MKKTLLTLLMLATMLVAVLTINATCFAEETSGEVAIETTAEETTDTSASTWFSTMWEKVKDWVLGVAGGTTVSAIVGAIVITAVKKASSAGFDKIEEATNSTSIAEKTSEKLLNNLSSVALDVNIKPLMEWQYKKLSEQINANLTIELDKQDKRNLALIECFEAFANYFKNSTVPEEDKQALSDAIANAKALYENGTKTVTATIQVSAEPTEEKTTTVAENY